MSFNVVLYMISVHELVALLPAGLFFFQAEDGIRDHCVTGVQTCALPISKNRKRSHPPYESEIQQAGNRRAGQSPSRMEQLTWRSEERRVGKECRSRWRSLN